MIVLAVLSAVAYAFVERSSRELLEPLMALPEGRAALAATMRRVALTLALFDLPLLIVVGIAAYALATLSVRPLREAREREERFAAEAAHELRTPLAEIAALAQSGKPEHLPAIARTALDASALLGDLLVLMRPGSGSRRLHEPVDLVRLARAQAQTAFPAAGRGFQVEAPASAYVIGDERELRRLIGNLCENARRYARALVTVRVRDEGGRVVLEVEDDGPGVPPELREQVFERFFKADPRSPGSGLGLAICRHIAVGHDGGIALEGRSRFVAWFPSAR